MDSTASSRCQETLLELVKRRISDRRVLKVMRQWLEAGAMEDGTVKEMLREPRKAEWAR